MDTNTIPQRLPDLFQPEVVMSQSAAAANNMNGGAGGVPASSSEVLAQDLLEILKQDKKILYGDAINLVNVAGETAGKAAKAIKSGFAKLKARYKASTSGVGSDGGQSSSGHGSGGEGDTQQQPQEEDSGPPDENSKSSAGTCVYKWK